MSRAALALLAALLASALAPTAPASAAAAFGIAEADLYLANEDQSAALEAGSHPFALSTGFAVDTAIDEEGKEVPADDLRDLEVSLPPGLAGIPTATPRCSGADFAEIDIAAVPQQPDCSNDTVVGYVNLHTSFKPVPPGEVGNGGVPLYNLLPAPGAVAKFGFIVASVPITVEARLSEEAPYRVIATIRNASQTILVYGGELTLWGNPASPAHDTIRGSCLRDIDSEGNFESNGSCPVSEAATETALITAPRACEGPLTASFAASSWPPGAASATATVKTHDAEGAPAGFAGCGGLAFAPTIGSAPTAASASSPSGLDFSLDVADEGISDPGSRAASDIRKAEVALPEGMTINPSQADGLAACSEAELARESAASAPGAGCPEASKIGTIEVETPLLENTILKGRLFVAEPYHNLAGDSLIALYVVIADRDLGIEVTQPLRVEPDPGTGRLVTYSEEMPQLPFSHLRLHLRGGDRAPLVSPPRCGTHTANATLYPWSGGAPAESTGAFEITSGPGGGACSSAVAPFAPGFEAGTRDNAAGSYSPFGMRLTRGQGEQDLAKLSAVLPPGVLGSVAGIPWCPEPAIAAAKARTGPQGAQEELDDPSCPAASQIGRTVAGAGAGSRLTYVGGALHLAGPYNGAPLSVVSITPAKAGPFDAGVVVVRVGLTLNPITARVEVDGAASDPIPHTLKGIPLNVRDLRVHADRPAFTLNATSCAESQTLATLWGAGTAPAPLPEAPVGRAARYQAAGCAALGFKPRLAIKLRGGAGRGAHPALKAVVTPRPGDANFDRAAVTLPRSAFLEQAHIRTICTRVRFAAGPGNGALCPKGARYGYARAWSPLLDGPAQGPVYLRSSDNKLPDLVAALKGPASAPFDVELSARIDSVRGGIRSTFAGIPDVPVSRFVLQMQGGKKGLIVNSRHLCHEPARNRARANIKGQNGRLSRTRPRLLALTCAKRRKAKRARTERAGSRVSRASAAR